MLKVKILPYLGDLGVEKSCWLGKLCFNNSHLVLCALSEEKAPASAGCPCTRAENSTCKLHNYCLLSGVRTRSQGLFK